MTEITETAQAVLEKRYFRPGETAWLHLADRVAGFFASDSRERENFLDMLCNLDAIPNSPVLMNADTEITSYAACFVLPIPDDMQGIFKYYSDAAMISKSGGGVGANFSSLRPAGSRVGSTGNAASGPVSFMKIQDTATDVIKQGGRRRGANMAILDCDHPDIKEFVGAKDSPGVLENFNLSVRVTDEFMDNVTGSPLEYTEEEALWDDMMHRAWSSAEPGVLFGDRIEEDNPTPELGRLTGTNPCGEQPLLPYESCSLISVNLSNHVDLDGRVDWEHLGDTVETSVVFMNRVLDKTHYPVPECNDAMALTRKIGVGIMGLHDMLIQMKLPYDSEEARDVAEEVMKYISDTALAVSMRLGEEEGTVYGLSRRNACLTTIAPTGTISMIADCSSGCEPYYAPMTYKTVLGETFEMPNKWVKPLGAEEGLSIRETLDVHHDLFKGAQEIHWKDHIKMQACLQEHVDSSISKTINMPSDATVADVREAYGFAWELGCKGLTIYRDGSRGAGVLATEGPSDSEESLTDLPVPWKLELPEELEARRYRVEDTNGNKVYFSVCCIDDTPVEVFARLPEESSDSYWNTICRLISLALRYNIPLDDVTKQLRKSSSSVVDTPSRLARILDKYKTDEDFRAVDSKELLCPDCQSPLVAEGGCFSCKSCGWEKCS